MRQGPWDDGWEEGSAVGCARVERGGGGLSAMGGRKVCWASGGQDSMIKLPCVGGGDRAAA